MGNPNMIFNSYWDASQLSFNYTPIRITNETIPGNNTIFTDMDILFNHYPRLARDTTSRLLIFTTKKQAATLGYRYMRTGPNQKLTTHFKPSIFQNGK